MKLNDRVRSGLMFFFSFYLKLTLVRPDHFNESSQILLLSFSSVMSCAVCELKHRMCMSYEQSPTAINPTRISLKPLPLQNALGLTHNSWFSLIHPQSLELSLSSEGTAAAVRLPAGEGKGEKSLPVEMRGVIVWWGGGQGSPLDTKWVNTAFMPHNPHLTSQ